MNPRREESLLRRLSRATFEDAEASSALELLAWQDMPYSLFSQGCRDARKWRHVTTYREQLAQKGRMQCMQPYACLISRFLSLFGLCATTN